MHSPIPYFGGKRWLADHIVSLIPPHVTYVEPFAGGAQVLFRKAPSRVEVLNDLDSELINFYRVVRAHAPELIRVVSEMIPSRVLFQQLLVIDRTSMTDVERAARFLYIQRLAFGAKVRGQSVALGISAKPRFDPNTVGEVLKETAERLKRAQLENLPYEKVLERYDRPTTLFYIDPPYVGTIYYQHNFEARDFEALATRLRALRGKFLMSLNADPLVEKTFRGFRIEPVPVRYTNRSLLKISDGHQQSSELMIRNY